MKKVLIIDDERDMCLIVKQNLESTGEYTVITAYSGREGIASAMHHRPDLILLDIIMPGMGGFEVLEKLKEMDETTAIPVVMLTAVGTEKAKERAMSIYSEDYLIKPVRTDALRAKIDEIFKRGKV